MNKLLVLLLLLYSAARAQDGDRVLKSFASIMAMNRMPQEQFYFDENRSLKRFDTLSHNAQHDRLRAFTYVWKGDYEQAIHWLDKTAIAYPKENGVIGELYLSQLHDYRRALNHFAVYDALTPTFDDIIFNSPVSYFRGLAHQHLGDHQKAVEQFSVTIDPLALKHGDEWVNYRHFISRAMSYTALGQAEKALIDLEKALRNYNRSALAQYHKGRALLRLNRIAEARTAFQDASFFFKVLRSERTVDYQEDDRNPLYEQEIEDALATLKTLSR